MFVEAVIDVEGRVRTAKVLYTDGEPTRYSPWTGIRAPASTGFESACLDAVLKWQFDPAHVDGRPVESTIEIPLVFELTGPPPN